MGRALDTRGEERNVYKLLVEKHEGKTVIGRPRCTCEVD
jgi:hypothetical protein